MTRLGNLLHLGNYSKPVGTIILAKLPILFGNFCKGVKIFNFSGEIIFRQLLQTFGNFLLVTLAIHLPMAACVMTTGSSCGVGLYLGLLSLVENYVGEEFIQWLR